jgi:hypothetical protein
MRTAILALTAIVLLAPSALARKTDSAGFIRSETSAGTLIQDPDAPVSFELPPGWTLSSVTRWGNHETTLSFEETSSGITGALYYQYPLQPPFPKDDAASLRGGMLAKVRQLQREGLTDYHIRADSVQTREVGGQPVLSFVAEFTAQGQSRVEYMVRVLGKTTKAHFFVQGIPAASDINAFREGFDLIANSLQIP